MFRSSGSSLEGFRDSVTERLAQLLSDWISVTAPEKQISELFFKTIAGFYIGAIEQLLVRKIAPEQDADQFRVFLKFICGGWSAVLKDE